MLHRILTAEIEYPGDAEIADRAFARFGNPARLGPNAGKVTTDVTPIVARVDEGRWVAECPFCHGAQVGSPADPRFLCTDCANVLVGGAYLQVAYPSPKVREQIEAVLAPRPWENLYWLPEKDETVADLVAQNVAEGIPVPA